MEFSTINELIVQLENLNIFKYTFLGFKALAFAILTLKIIDKLVKNIGKEELPLGEFYSLLGIMLLIGGSDFIIDSIEGVFNGIQNEMNVTNDGKIDNLIKAIADEQMNQFNDVQFWFEYITLFLENFNAIIWWLILGVITLILKIVDLSVTFSYLLLRVFYLAFLKMIFPLVIALSTFDTNLSFLQSWIKRYIGIYILGVAYIGILNFTQLIMNNLSFELDMGGNVSNSLVAGVVTIVVVISIKVKLFSNVTSYVTGMFQ